MIKKQALLETITSFYLKTRGFNGIPVRDLANKYKVKIDDLIGILTELIKEERIDIVFGDIHPNPHIKAFDEPKEEQITKITPAKLNQACAYPSTAHLKEAVDSTVYQDRPYVLCLALGTSQLDFKAFELSILEYYRNDPRYYYNNDDIRGHISAHDTEGMAERDQVFLQTFGFCYDSNLNRAVAVFVRYLADLSPEHQQIWKAKELSGDYKLHPDYYRNTILGEWVEKIPIFDAFIYEMKIINQMARVMERPPFFKEDFSDHAKPREFGFLVRPTLKEFEDFVRLLDKLISDNINKDFFLQEVPFEHEDEANDGKKRVRDKGTLTILDEWLQLYFHLEDRTPINEMLKIFKLIRKLRQPPAHSISDNLFDQKYIHKQRDLIGKAYTGIRTLRHIFANHPKVRVTKIEIPESIFKGEIRSY